MFMFISLGLYTVSSLQLKFKENFEGGKTALINILKITFYLYTLYKCTIKPL